VKSIKALQAYILRLLPPESNGFIEEKGLISQKACNVYKDGDPNSIGFTVSSLMFRGIKEGCEVKGFS